MGLYFFDLETQKLSECYYRDKRYDFGATAGLAFHRPTGRLLGIRYEKSGPYMEWFEPDMQELQKLVDSKVPGKTNIIEDWDREMTRFLIASYSEQDPGTYYFLDLQRMKFIRLFNARPWIRADQLAKTQILNIKTPDGLVWRDILPNQETEPNRILPWFLCMADLTPATHFSLLTS